jgi:hypothetical protein
MDDLEQLAKDTLAPGIVVILRSTGTQIGRCLCSTEEHCSGVREWMESKKAETVEHPDFTEQVSYIIEAVDSETMEVLEVVWEGDV